MMRNIVNSLELKVPKKFHPFTLASDDDRRALSEDGTYLTPAMSEAYAKVHEVCGTWGPSGRLRREKKIWISDVNVAFHEHVQAHFTGVYVQYEKDEVLNTVNEGAGKGDRTISSSRGSHEGPPRN